MSSLRFDSWAGSLAAAILAAAWLLSVRLFHRRKLAEHNATLMRYFGTASVEQIVANAPFEIINGDLDDESVKVFDSRMYDPNDPAKSDPYKATVARLNTHAAAREWIVARLIEEKIAMENVASD